jgi:protein-L-isoaspartate(D-aspartate) O-methyltransferase
MDFAVLRDDMVEGLEYHAKDAVRSERVSVAMREVPRHEFVDADERAYLDQSFEHRGSTVLAPSLAARLVEAVDVGDDSSVLVVGAGVGYTAAVLAELVGQANVHAVDISRDLVWDARRNLADAGYDGVLVDCRDGADGLPEYAPFDRVLVEAAAVRPPTALLDQLADDGRLVMPMGAGDQTLVAVDRDGRVVDEFCPVGFQPLLVDGEQSGAVERNRTAREERERAAREARSRKGWEHDWIDWDGRI